MPGAKIVELTREEQVAKVIELMESGLTENKACNTVGINRGTFRSAALRYESADNYARALAELAQQQAELAEVAIQDMRAGKIDAQMARVEIDTRKWFASKFLPRRYGDKIDMTTNGKDLPSPILSSVLPSDTKPDVLDLT